MTHRASADERFMRVALGLAKRALGRAAPNPAVGCVIVDEAGHIVGRGWTQPGGRPHAETVALEKAGAFAQGATAYVSLEPCAHHGRTPPCTDALIKAKVKRVVTACEDPDPRTRGRGVEMMRQAGIEVTTGVLAREAADLNAGFFLKVMEGRPLVSLKVAASLDGRIATMSGESKWITGEEARAYAHLLRARHDAVMIGIGTATSDDPDLTVRLPGMEDRKPVRIVADSRLRIQLTAKLVKSARDVPTWILTRADGGHERRRALGDLGVTLVDVPAGEDGTMDMRVALKKLAERGLTRVMVEGGARISAALIRARLVDRLHWFRAGLLIGGDGVAAVAALGLNALADAPRLEFLSSRRFGEDVVEMFAIRK